MRTHATGLIFVMLALVACVREERLVSFSNDVQPILNAHCIECHSAPDGAGYLKAGVSLATYADLMRGATHGAVIVPGDSRHSILNMLVEGRADPSLRMPHGRKPLDDRDIETLRRWVEQGALNN